MKSLKIAIDIDGVVCDFTNSALEVIREVYGISIRLNQIIYHNLEFVLGLSKQEVEKIIVRVLNNPSNVNPVSDCKPILQKLIDDGHHITLLTSRRLVMRHVTQVWLDMYKIPHHELVFMTDYREYPVRFDIMLDDFPAKLIDIENNVEELVLFTQPWNTRCLDLRGRFTRIANWQQFLVFVNKVSRQQ